MEETAYAKINLALHVRGREQDGYHRIETLFAFAEEGDRLSVTDSDQLALRIVGRFASSLAATDDNLVLRAAEALRRRYRLTRGAALMLDKRLPVASGIGGGSADAAAALRLLDRWWRLNADARTLMEIGAALGADVPACVKSCTARGEGRGDQLFPLGDEGLRGVPILLVNSGTALSTADVFRAWDGEDRGPLPHGSPMRVAASGRNDLEPPARALAPQIDAVLHFLSAADGAGLVRMSGSGATCFALFETDEHRDAAALVLEREHPGWWHFASRLR